MSTSIPSAGEVKTRLQSMSYAETKQLATAAGVPFTTLWKMRTGETRNPGVETVRQFWHLICPSFTQGAPAAPTEHTAA